MMQTHDTGGGAHAVPLAEQLNRKHPFFGREMVFSAVRFFLGFRIGPTATVAAVALGGLRG